MSLPSSFLAFFLRTIQLNHSKKETRDDNLDLISDTTYSFNSPHRFFFVFNPVSSPHQKSLHTNPQLFHSFS